MAVLENQVMYVQGVTEDSWKKMLLEILKEYLQEDIYNLDETGCFLEAVPEQG